MPEQTEVALSNPEEATVVAETETAEVEAPLVDLIPTKDGTLGAEGITLFAGVPDIIPPVREQLKISPDPLKDILPRIGLHVIESVMRIEVQFRFKNE